MASRSVRYLPLTLPSDTVLTVRTMVVGTVRPSSDSSRGRKAADLTRSRPCRPAADERRRLSQGARNMTSLRSGVVGAIAGDSDVAKQIEAAGAGIGSVYAFFLRPGASGAFGGESRPTRAGVFRPARATRHGVSGGG